jgi:4-hydroxybenzoate polyprenyltransferase
VLAIIAADIKIAHSVFALPFAVLGAFLAAETDSSTGWANFGVQLVLVVVCMVFARTWAMLVNRLVDRDIDTQNARTARRAFASGVLHSRTGWMVAAFCAALFVGVTALFWWLFQNPWPTYLALPVLAWIAFYSFTKRFTSLCHLFLGGALAASPVAAAIAIEPEALLRTPAIWWLAGFVMFWVAGFDVIYALQDEEFDREKGLASIPAKLGSAGAEWASRALHCGAVFMLLSAWASEPRLGPIFGAGIVLVVALLALEHVIVARRPRGTPGAPAINMAFFTVNGVVSCGLGAIGCIDLLI